MIDLDATFRVAREQGWQALDEPTGKQVLSAFGLCVPKFCVLRSSGDIPRVAEALRPPYVLKAVSPEIIHKSDYGAVKIGLQSVQDVERALESVKAALAARRIREISWLVEEMVPGGLECVIGGVIDPEFGPMVMVGLGGVFVEVLKDVAFRICPIEVFDAHEMLQELRGAALLGSARGKEPVSVDAVVDALLKVGSSDGVLMRCASEVAEIDINPLIVTRDAAFAVDARFILNRPAIAR